MQNRTHWIIESLEYLADFLRSDAGSDFEEGLNVYLQTKMTLAREFAELARADLKDQLGILDETIQAIEEELSKTVGDGAPGNCVKLPGFKSIHAVLLAYLWRNRGKSVPSSKLRLLTADQVHTERRVRELRDLGFVITWRRESGQNCYRMEAVAPQIAAAAEKQLRRNAKLAPGR
jgi:hypothetical protein